MRFYSMARKSAAVLAHATSRALLSSPVVAPSLLLINSRRVSHAHVLESFSTLQDVKSFPAAESLLRVIDSEIQVAEENGEVQVDEAPNDFPFEIEDNPGQMTVTLKRGYNGEEVKIEVYMPDLVTGDDNIDDYSDVEGGRPNPSRIPIFVTITKENGSVLNFSCVASTERISIQSMSVTSPDTPESNSSYTGPDFKELNDKFKAAFHKYLEMRGVTTETTNFLHEYMINKDGREYMIWLKNLKSFVQA